MSVSATSLTGHRPGKLKMPSHDLEAMEETFLDQQELLVYNKQAAQEKMKGKRRLLKTVALSMAFFCVGLCVAIPGPTLLDLGRRVNCDIEHMTFIFTARSVGFLIGSLVGGVLFDFFDQQILLFYTLAVVAVATAGVPWCSVLLTLSTLICLQGVAVGVLDTGGNIFCIKIWGKQSGPFMQFLHFAFGIGAFLAPLIARPFLMDIDVGDNTTIRGYHPVISLVSRSAHNQFVRDVSSLSFMDQGYALNHNSRNIGLVHSKSSLQMLKNDSEHSQTITENLSIFNSAINGGDLSERFADPSKNDLFIKQIKDKLPHNKQDNEQANTEITTIAHTFNLSVFPSWHKSHFLNEKSRWRKKFNEKYQNSIIIYGAKNLHSKVDETGKHTVHETRTSIPYVNMNRPKKPGFYNHKTLSQERADAAFIGSKLKDLKNKLPQRNPEKDVTRTAGDVHPKHNGNFFTENILMINRRADDTTDEEVWNNVTLVRAKRDNSKVTDTDKGKTEKNGTQIFGNETASNLTSTSIPIQSVITVKPHQTSTSMPSVIAVKNAKPSNTNGDNLSGGHADASIIDPLIKEIKDKQDNEQAKNEITTIAHTLNMTTEMVESENGTNTTQDWNSTRHIYIPGISRFDEKTTIVPSMTSIKSTKVLTTTTATITTSTITTSTTAESTRVNSATTSLSTESTKALDALTTNTSSAPKPRATGDFIRDLVTSLTGMSKIQIAYPVIGLLLAVNSGFFLFLHCKDRTLKSPLYIRRYQDPSRNPYTKCFVASVILLLFLFFLAYMGMEVTFGGLLATFAVNYPGEPWTPAEGASLTSLFWGCLTVGRGFSIFIARCVKPSSMIVMNLGLTVLGALILSFVVPANPAALWVGTVIFGLGISSLFPTAILWANSCYPLSSSATAVFVAGCGVGEMTVPLLTGYLYENVTKMVVMYVIFFLSGLLSMLYISIQMLVYRKGRMSQQRSNSGFVRLKNMEEVEDENDLGVVEGINLGIMETTWRRRVQGEEEKRGEIGGKQIMEFTKLMEM